MSTQTYPAPPEQRNWYVLDAGEFTLGRLASHVATVLRGKHKPVYSPHQDHGDHVVVVNADKVQITGRKLKKKTYFRHTGYMGGVKLRTLEEMMTRQPEEVVRIAVRGMLPKNRLGRRMIKKLKVYVGPEHPHQSQAPQPMPIYERTIHPSAGGTR